MNAGFPMEIASSVEETYCHTQCKKNKERMQAEIYHSINNAMHGIFGHLLGKQTSLFR